MSEQVVGATLTEPWGVSRMESFMPVVPAPAIAMSINAETQIAVCTIDGTPVPYHVATGTRGRLTDTPPPDGKSPGGGDRDHADD